MRSPIAKLPLRNEDGDVLAVIEVTAGSRSKFRFEPELGVFVLHKWLPLGTAYPCDFGYLPQTLGGDGDPLDVLVLMDEPVSVGSVVPCRIVGILKAEQTERATTVRNDRLLAVARSSLRYAAVHDVTDIDVAALDQLEAFFVFYEAQAGKTYTPLGRGGAGEAQEAIECGVKAARHGKH